MKMSYVIKAFIFAGLITVTSTDEILYPGDVVRYTTNMTNVLDSALIGTDGYVLRVVSKYDIPNNLTILVSWISGNFSVSWKSAEMLTLQKRSECAFITDEEIQCKQESPGSYVNDYLGKFVKIGMLFRAITFEVSTFWTGDLFIYLGTENGTQGLDYPLNRFWCFRSEKIVLADSLEKFQVMGVTNYPGVYEDYVNNQITGYYRYPVLSSYNVSISLKQLMKGSNNTATLTMACNNDKKITSIVYHSLMYDTNYTTLTTSPISVPFELQLETTWIASNVGPNYIEFRIQEFNNTDNTEVVATGLWYDVVGEATQNIQIQAPGSDQRFTEVKKTITITQTSKTSVFMACLFFHNNQSHLTDKLTHVTNTQYDQRGLHKEVFAIVWNKLSIEITELSLAVMQVLEVQNVTVSTRDSIIKTHADAVFHVQAFNGYGMSCVIAYGDDSEDTVNKTLSEFYDTFENDTDIDSAIKTDPPKLFHNFTKTGGFLSPGYYNVCVTCHNEINTASYSTTVLAQDEITEFTAHVEKQTFQFGQAIKVLWSIEVGTDVQVDIWYNDIYCNTSMNDQTQFSYCLVDNEMFFDADTKVDIKAIAWNKVSNVTKIVVVEVLEKLMITNFVALTTTSQFGSGVPGVGPNKNMFPAEHPVLLTADYTGSPATAHNITYDYGERTFLCSSCGERTDHSVAYAQQFENETNTIEVTLKLSNAAGSDEYVINIDMETSFKIASVTMNNPVLVNKKETIIIELDHIGSHTCLAVDFNDSTPLSLYGDRLSCKRQYNDTSDGQITTKDESTKRIVIEHVFTALKVHQIKIDGNNYVSSDSFEKVLAVALMPCNFPNVTITGFNDGELPEHNKSEILTLSTENELDCELTNLTRTTWSVFKLAQDPRSKLSAIDDVPRSEHHFLPETNLTSPELVLESRSLEYGFYAVTARLEMDIKLKDHPVVFGETTKYFYVVASMWLEPAVTTGFIYKVLYREKATLNASATADPDFEVAEGITYEWFCRDADDTKEFGPHFDKVPVLHVPLANETFPPADINSTGCFGKGRGRLNVTNVLLEMESFFMVEGKIYIITLVTSLFHPEFGLRRSSTDIYFQVLMGLPPDLQLKCVKNCRKKVNPDEKLIVKAACAARCYGELAFEWSLFWFDHIDTPEPFDLKTLNNETSEILQTMVTNPVDELEMAFKPNTLVSSRKYILQLKATRPNAVFGELRYTLVMNDAPKDGVCGISPPSGVALMTTFNITCTNWVDPDSPLTYDYAYEIDGTKTVFFSDIGKPGETIVSSGYLPIGELEIVVNIKDKFKGTTELSFTVKVDPPGEMVSVAYLDGLLAGGMLDTLIDGGDPQKALLMGGVIASVFNNMDSNKNTTGNLTADEIAKRQDEIREIDELKQGIMKSMSTIDVSNMATLLQLSGTTQALTETSENLSPETQDLGLQLCRNSTTGLTMLSQQESSFKNIQSAVKNLAGINGQLINAAIEPQKNLTITNASISRAESSISMLDDLHEATLRFMVTNEGPSTSNTKHITLQSEKLSLKNMGKKRNVANKCSFKPPNPEVLGFGEIVRDVNATISQLATVTVKMEVFNKNPYTWDKTSKSVTSKIASLNMNSSKQMQTSNLTEDIGITISRDPSQFPEAQSFYMKPDKPDPDFDGNAFLKYHCFNRSSRWTSMNFEIYPEDVSLNLNVYLKTGSKPDLKLGDFNLKYELPDFSSCSLDEHNVTQDNDTIVIDPFSHCDLHPYSVFVSNVDFNETGQHCFAVQVKNGTTKSDDPNSANTRRKRSFACDIGKRRMRRSCVIIPPPPPPPPTQSPFKVMFADNLGFDGKYFFPNQTPNYNMTMFESSCLYWDEENKTWTGHGCRVGPLTSRTDIQCFCNHLTSFGSDLVVAPNPIDFSSVFSNFGSLQDNVAVLALISTVLGLYILGVLWGRRADKNDLLMIGPTILPSPQGSYHYLLTLYTGNRLSSGTTAKVFFKMAGDNNETVPIKLRDAKRPCFERGQTNEFIVSYPQAVGELSYIQIWHNNDGLSPSWYLSRLSVKDIQTNQQWYFVCDNWLAVESEDGKVCRVIPVANDQELTNFNQLFTARTVKGLADGHLWFSIFSRPPSSNFTRVQRLSCCLCLLCCTMITSAMFYNMGGDGPSPFAIHIGSLVIDLKGFVIGLESSLIIVPVNVAIVQIFRNLRPKQGNEEEVDSEKTTEDSDSENKESEETKPKGKLPHWFIYIAYGLCYLASAASIFFTLLYSIQWGKTKSTEWVIAMVTAFLQSVLLLQPVKVLVLAVVFAVIVRKPSDNDQDDAPVIYDPPSSATATKRRRSRKMKIYSPPDPETLQEARAKRLKEIQMNKIMKEIAAFFIFLVMLMNVAYYHRDPNTFLMTKTLYETFDEVDAYSIDLAAVSEGDSLWMWARETLVPGLYATEWYNGKKVKKGFIANMEDYLVGVPRIRLVRVEQDSCSIDKFFKDSIPHCYSSFSLATEENRAFDVSWESLDTETSRKRRDLQVPVTEKEWLERMSMGTQQDDILSGDTLHGDTLPGDTLPGDTIPGDTIPGETLLERINGLNVRSTKRDKYSSRQKRALDPITSSISGKKRRKKKRLLGSAKPKEYLIREEALLPSGKLVSCLERWRHQTTLEMRGFPYWGEISLYSGGGYAANLGYDPVSAYTVIADLHSNGWIDVQSRAVFVEFTVYNANTNLFGIVSIMVEFPSSSAAFTKVQYQAGRFYLQLDSVQTVSHVLVIFFMIYFLYREGKLVYKERWAYFKGFWNWVETILVISEFMTIVLFLARLYEVDRNLIQLRENPNDYVPFQYAASADALLCYILGILVFFYTLRFCRLLRFNKNFAVLGKTLYRISVPILGFCVPFFFAFIAFGLFAFSVFGTELEDYSTFQMTMVTQFSITLGDFDFEALVMVNPLLGPLYFFGFIGLNIFILMNVFLAIINDSYAEIQEEEDETKNEYEILEYIMETLQSRVKGEPKKIRKTRKVNPKKTKETKKPHYVTFRESEKKFSGVNVSKLENCDAQLESLLDKLQHVEHDENQTYEAIEGAWEVKQHDIYLRVMVLMETVD